MTTQVEWNHRHILPDTGELEAHTHVVPEALVMNKKEGLHEFHLRDLHEPAPDLEAEAKADADADAATAAKLITDAEQVAKDTIEAAEKVASDTIEAAEKAAAELAAPAGDPPDPPAEDEKPASTRRRS